MYECLYDDYRKKSRLQHLREKVAALEIKLAELEANPQAHLQTTLIHDSPAADLSTSFTDPPFDGQSPKAFDWQLTEGQRLDASSSLSWPDPIASNNWATRSGYQSYDSDLLQLRQTTPAAVTISPETQQYL